MKWVTTRNGVNYVFYPENADGFHEPAICLQPYNDSLTLETCDAIISLSYESIPEFIKLLKMIKADNEK